MKTVNQIRRDLVPRRESMFYCLDMLAFMLVAGVLIGIGLRVLVNAGVIP